jgi:thymidylate synthase
MGSVYGAALEDWELPELFEKLMAHEDDRGLMINFWRPAKFDKGCLRPCLYSHLFTIVGDTLHLKSSQRSCDMLCGKNFNALQVYMLLAFFAHITGLKAGIATHEIVNPHIYEDHIEGVEELLVRELNLADEHFLSINEDVTSFEDLLDDSRHSRDYFTLVGDNKYSPQPRIKFDLIV